MLSAESFLTSSLRSAPEGGSIARILAASIHAVEPGAAVARFVRRNGDELSVSGRAYDLKSFRHMNLLGIGKASVAMSQALAEILGPRLEAGLAIPKHSTTITQPRLTVLQGDHPIPGSNSLLAGAKAMEFVSSLGPDDLLFCLISGGGSALVTAPLEGISLEDLQVLTSTLLACGARIDEINSLRRRLERLN